MSDEAINVKQFVLICYVPQNGKFAINYFKWLPNGDLGYAPGIKNAAIFKPGEIERTIKLLQESQFPHKLQPQPVK